MFPSVLDLKIRADSGFRLRLWLPVIIVWPVILILVLLLLPFLAIAELVLRSNGQRICLFKMLNGLLAVCWYLGGTKVNVRSLRQNSIVYVSMY
jgi:hypothetical protein